MNQSPDRMNKYSQEYIHKLPMLDSDMLACIGDDGGCKWVIINNWVLWTVCEECSCAAIMASNWGVILY